MKKLTKEELRKLQLIQLEILIEFDKICKKHNLKLIRISYLDNLKERLEEIINEL